MFATVWRILRDSHDAEDALHDALTTIWRQWEAVVRHPTPQALVLRICADTAIDHYRRRRRQEHAELAEQAFPGEGTLPLEAAIRRETFDEIMAAIARLSPHQATAVVMRFVQGESYETIAAALGCGTATARTHIARGRERLEQLLQHLAQESIP